MDDVCTYLTLTPLLLFQVTMIVLKKFSHAVGSTFTGLIIRRNFKPAA